jgi:Kef-type K+ transport system membrane component KefB
VSSGGPSSVRARILQLVTLGGVIALTSVATQLTPHFHGAGALIGGIGLLLMAGTLTSEIFGLFRLPHLTGYIAAGIVAGPHVLGLIDHDTVGQLSVVGTLALALIALAGGAELRLEHLRQNFKSLAWSMVIQCGLVAATSALAFVAIGRFLPFTARLPLSGLIGVAVLWAVVAISRSPSATLAILSQTRAKGPVSQFTLGFVMSSDVIVLMVLAIVFLFVRPLLDAEATFSLHDITALGHEMLGSAALGTALGILLIIYLRLVGRQLLLVLLAIGYGLTAALSYLHFDPLLAFLIAGFVVSNFSRQGEKLLSAIEQTSAIVFVVFFAAAGAHLDLPLIRRMWPLALALCTVRAFTTLFAHRLGMRLAPADPDVKRWGWSGLVSQAGLTLGISLIIERTFPSIGVGFRSLAVTAVAVNEIVGPILFKLALDRTGESAQERLSLTAQLAPK